MHDQRLADDVAHGHARVQGGIGVLEDHLHPAAHLPQRFALQLGQVLALKVDLTSRRAIELQDGPSGRRLATARFAHQAQGLALQDVKANAIHRLDGADLRWMMIPWVMGKCIFRSRTCTRVPFSVIRHTYSFYNDFKLRRKYNVRVLWTAVLGCWLSRIRAPVSHPPSKQCGAWVPRFQFGPLRPALFDGIDTARLKRTARWQGDQVGGQPLNGRQLVLADLIQPGQRAQKADGVGMAGIGVDLLDRAPLPRQSRRT